MSDVMSDNAEDWFPTDTKRVIANRNMINDHMKKEAELKGKFGPDFEQPAFHFSVNKAEAKIIDAWVESLKPEIMEIQQLSTLADLAKNEPYYGAIGGGLKYSFIPTGLGNILVVTETITKKELNVTDALDWYFFG